MANVELQSRERQGDPNRLGFARWLAQRSGRHDDPADDPRPGRRLRRALLPEERRFSYPVYRKRLGAGRGHGDGGWLRRAWPGVAATSGNAAGEHDGDSEGGCVRAVGAAALAGAVQAGAGQACGGGFVDACSEPEHGDPRHGYAWACGLGGGAAGCSAASDRCGG